MRVGLAAGLSLVPAEAGASQPSRGPDPGRLERPHGRGMRVIDEDVRFTCESGDNCEFEARWTIEVSDTATPVELWLHHGEWSEVSIDGQVRSSAEIWLPAEGEYCFFGESGRSHAQLDCGELHDANLNDLELVDEGRKSPMEGAPERLYRTYRVDIGPDVDPVEIEMVPYEAPSGPGFRTYILDAGQHEVHASGRLYPQSSRPGGASWPVLEIRHIWLTTPPVWTSVQVIGNPVAGQQLAQLDLHGREGRLVREHDTRVRWVGHRHHRATFKGSERDEVNFEIDLGQSRVGGPLLGFGAGFTGEARFRLRAGYEFGSASFLAHQITVESDFQRVLLVVGTDAATPNLMMFIPSFGGGLGVPVQVWPEARVGVRVQSALSWPFFSIVGHFDVFPQMGGSEAGSGASSRQCVAPVICATALPLLHGEMSSASSSKNADHTSRSAVSSRLESDTIDLRMTRIGLPLGSDAGGGRTTASSCLGIRSHQFVPHALARSAGTPWS